MFPPGGVAMEFSLVSPDKLKVALSREDLAGLNITCAPLDYSDGHTREVLLGLLDRGRIEAGFAPRRAKLYIEAYPNDDGGCVVYYTRLVAGEVFPAGKFIPGPVPAVYLFRDMEVLIAACAKLLPRYGHRIYKSSLYELGGSYRLIIWPLDYNDNLSRFFLSEYGSLVGEGSLLVAFAEEHGVLLRGGDAIEALSLL